MAKGQCIVKDYVFLLLPRRDPKTGDLVWLEPVQAVYEAREHTVPMRHHWDAVSRNPRPTYWSLDLVELRSYPEVYPEPPNGSA